MNLIEILFSLVLKISILSFVLLGIGVLFVRCIHQPIERIRLIQLSIAAVTVACVLGIGGWHPTVELPFLPSKIGAIDNESPSAHYQQSNPTGLVFDVRNNESKSAEVSHKKPRDLNIESSDGPDAPSNLVANSLVESPSGLEATLDKEEEGLADQTLTSTTTMKTGSPGFSGFVWFMVETAIVVGFVLGSLWQVGYFIFGFMKTRQLVKQAEPSVLPSSIHLQGIVDAWQDPISNMRVGGRPATKVKVLFSEKVGVPFAAGIFAPVIVLPKNMSKLDSQNAQIARHSLAHEWKHIANRDLLTWRIVNVFQFFLWVQPFFWVLKRELRVSQDLVADGFASKESNDHAGYAAALFRLAKKQKESLVGALTMAGTQSNLFRRIEMLLDPKHALSSTSRKSVLCGFGASIAVASFLALSLQLTSASYGSGALSNPSEVNLDLDEDSENSAQGNENQESNPSTEKTIEEPAEHKGTVIDATTGKPIANAFVIVTRLNSKDWSLIDKTESRTDSEGNYVFQVPPSQLKQRYLYLLFDVRHDTYAPRHCGSYSYSMITKNLKLGDKPWFSVLRMTPGAKLQGRIVDAQGNPVSGAQIRLNSTAPRKDAPGANSLPGGADFSFDRSNNSMTKTVTDDEGKFHAVVTKEGVANISVIPKEHCMITKDLGSSRGDIGDIQVVDGVSITGKVIDALGKPQKGVWVNISENGIQGAAYDSKRSCQTDANGEFKSRPLRPGLHTAIIEMKATGAIEKKPLANFHDDPPPAVFVRQTLEITEASADQPFVIQAVPHIVISGQCYNSKGEKAKFHMPSIMGRVDGQLFWLYAVPGDEPGSFELKAPHGARQARLSFATNEHSALTVQLPDSERPSVEGSFEMDRIEEDIADIKVVRYVAPVLQVKLVDETGAELNGAQVGIVYQGEPKPDPRLVGIKTHAQFERQTDKLFRSSQLLPNKKFEVFAKKRGYKSERKQMSMEEGKEKTIQIIMKPIKDNSDSKNK